MAAVEIERPAGDAADSSSFRLLPSGRGQRIRRIDPGQDLGTALRRARRRRRISLEQAARDTRIAVRYLVALENGGSLDAFPAPMYARAFLREYARYLRIEPEPLLQLLTPYEPPPVAPTLAVLTRAAPERRPRGRVIALAGAAVLSVLVVLGSQDPLARPPVSDPVADIEPMPTIAAPAAPDLGEEQPRGLPAGGSAVVASTTGRSWLRVTVDGKVVYEGTAPAGWSRSFHAGDRVEMLIGNAAAIDLTVGGRSYGALGRSGEVKRVLIVPGPNGPDVRVLDRKA